MKEAPMSKESRYGSEAVLALGTAISGGLTNPGLCKNGCWLASAVVPLLFTF